MSSAHGASPGRLSDTHCHLNLPEFAADLPDVLSRADTAGVVRVLVPAIDLATGERALDLAAGPQVGPRVYVAVGVHPNEAADSALSLPEAVEQVRQLASRRSVVAIGEIGLDYYWQRAEPRTQRAWLEAHLALATELELPVVLHNREAPLDRREASCTDDLLVMVATWCATLPTSLKGRCGVLHSFSGTLAQALRAIELGLRIGIAGPVTFRNAPELRELVGQLPVDSLLVETDAPYLSPQPHRGKRNEPAWVVLTATLIAQLHGMTLPELASRTEQTAAGLFRW